MHCHAKAALALLIAVGAFGAADDLLAQAYPSRDITFVVPYNPGGSTDPIARQFSNQLEKVLKVGVNVENKPGGAGTIGAGQIMRAKPDGYTIGLSDIGALAYQPLINKSLVYKTSDDYQPIIKLSEQPVVLVVKADAPFNESHRGNVSSAQHKIPQRKFLYIPGIQYSLIYAFITTA